MIFSFPTSERDIPVTSHHPGRLLALFDDDLHSAKLSRLPVRKHVSADAAHSRALRRVGQGVVYETELHNYTQRANDSIGSVASTVAVHHGTEDAVPASSQGNFHPIWRSPRQNLSSLGSEQRSLLLFASTVPRSITTTTITTRNNLFLLPPPPLWFIILLTRPPNKSLGGISLVLFRKKRIRPYSIRIINVCLMLWECSTSFLVTDLYFVCFKHTTRRIIPSLENL